MNAEEFAEMMMDAMADREEGMDDVRTFAEAGVMTSNDGFVVRMEDGSEFQVTVVRSR